MTSIFWIIKLCLQGQESRSQILRLALWNASSCYNEIRPLDSKGQESDQEFHRAVLTETKIPETAVTPGFDIYIILNEKPTRN